MKQILDQILEIYFLGGDLNEALAAVTEYRKTIYAIKTERQMLSGWR